MSRVLFLTVSDGFYFPGTLAAVRSIRRGHPRERIAVVSNDRDKDGLSDPQRELLAASGAQVYDAAAFHAPGRHLAAWELKAYAARDLAGECDVLVGFDSDLLLCRPVDDVIREALRSGTFIGGRDGSGEDYDERFEVYGIRTPARNPSYMSTSLYFCATSARNRGILDRWVEHTNQAQYNGRGDSPGHGDQGVLNAVLFAHAGPGAVTLLPNALWSQHWRYWRDEIVYHRGEFRNRTHGSQRQRAFHCGCSEKFWERAHSDRVREGPGSRATGYTWFLFLLWFGGAEVDGMPPTRYLRRDAWHLMDHAAAFIDHLRCYDPALVEARWPLLGRLLLTASATDAHVGR